MTIKLIMAALVLATGLKGHAGDVGNGGSGSEVELASEQAVLEQTVSKIKIFFMKNKHLEQQFPEINFTRLNDAANRVKLEVTNDVLVDRHGVTRTCLNFSNSGLIQCNYDQLGKTRHTPQTIFVLMFHELLGIMGVEETSPKDVNFIDGYGISKRLAPFVLKTSEYDLVYAPKVGQSKSVHGSVSLKRGVSYFFMGRTRGLKDAVLAEAKIECLNSYEQCEVPEESYSLDCDKFPGGWVCTGTAAYRGNVPRNESKPSVFLSSWQFTRRPNLKSVEADSIRDCFLSGYRSCALAASYKLRFRHSDVVSSEYNFNAKALTIGSNAIDRTKTRVFTSIPEVGGSDKKAREYLKKSALQNCADSGAKNCKLIYSSSKGLPGSALAIGDI